MKNLAKLFPCPMPYVDSIFRDASMSQLSLLTFFAGSLIVGNLYKMLTADMLIN